MYLYNPWTVSYNFICIHGTVDQDQASYFG